MAPAPGMDNHESGIWTPWPCRWYGMVNVERCFFFPLFPPLVNGPGQLDWNICGISDSGLWAVQYDGPNQRLLSPLYPAFLLITGIYSGYLYHKIRTKRQGVAYIIFLGIWGMMLWAQIHQLPRVVSPLQRGERGGWGWRANPVLQKLRTSGEIRAQCTVIYSNAPWLVYLWGEVEPVHPFPPETPGFPKSQACLVWLRGASESEISLPSQWRPLFLSSAGGIYRLGTGSPSD